MFMNRLFPTMQDDIFPFRIFVCWLLFRFMLIIFIRESEAYNRIGFRTSAEFGIYPTSGIPMHEPRCMICQELYKGSMKDIRGYVVYDMYENA